MEPLVPDAEPLLSLVIKQPELLIAPFDKIQFQSSILHTTQCKLGSSSVAFRSWILRSPLKNHLGVF